MSESADVPKLIWEADSTHPEKAERVREALREVVDPEIQLNVIELGLVRELSISDTEAHMRMIMTTPFCPYGPALLEMTRSKVEQAAGLPTTIEVGMEMWDPSMMEEGAGAAWGFY
jgi:metal-sulfur cluster biosynthetic enzyme